MRQVLARFAVVILLLGVTSCTGDGPDFTWLRMVNAVPDSPSLRATWDEYVFRRDFTFGTSTSEGGESLLKANGPDARVTVSYLGGAGGVEGTLLTADVSIEKDSTSTVILAGSFDAPEAITVVSPRLSRPLASLHFQFAHAALDLGPVDIYVTGPETELTSTAPLATVAPRAASGIFEVPFGTLRIRLTPAGSLDVIFDSGSRAFPESTATTGPGAQWFFTVTPSTVAGPSAVFAIASNGRESFTVFDVDTPPTLRAFNAARSRPLVDVYTAIDPPGEGEGDDEESTPPAPELEQLLYAALPFRQRSPLVPMPTGRFRIAFAAPGGEDEATFSAVRDFFGAVEHSAFLAEGSGGQAVVINDSPTRSIATEARLRFAHVSPDLRFLSFYLAETEEEATELTSLLYRDLLPGQVSTYFPGKPGEYFLAITERFYESAAEAPNAEDTLVFGPVPVTFLGGDVITWVVFPGDAEDDPPVVTEFDDRLP